MLRKPSRRTVLTATAAVLGMPVLAGAQAFPERPITVVVPFPAGGVPDLLMRTAAQGMHKTLGQAVVIDNRPGAAGNIGTAAVARARPDGYTLLFALNMLVTNPHVYKRSAYDPVKNFEPISLAGWGLPISVVANASLKDVNTADQLIALAKSRPGVLTYSSPGAGTPQHLGMELFKMTAGIDIVHVPYKSTNDMVLAIGRNEIDVSFMNIAQALPLAADGRLKILGIDSDAPYPQAPRVPLFKDAGLPRFKLEPWYGLLAPAGTPADVVARLNRAYVAALEEPAAKATLLAAGVVVATSSPEAFGRLIREDYARWGKIISEARISVD